MMLMYREELITPDKLYPMIGYNIRQIRIKQNMTQEQLAEAVGLDQKQISRIESGKACPTLSSYLRIANAFLVSIDHLLRGAGQWDLSQFSSSQHTLPISQMGVEEERLVQAILTSVLKYLQEKE